MDKHKLKVLRVKLRSLTASFRQIGFITGYQPTLPVPPLSTIFGIISAAKGEFIQPNETKVGYIFRNKSKAVDLEKIYQVEGNFGFNENIVKREFFYDNQLCIYLTNLDLEEYFKNPRFQLLIGRSSDLAFVEEVKSIELTRKEKVTFSGTILPQDTKLPGMKVALPSYFIDSIPRRPAGIKPFLLIGNNLECVYKSGGLVDEELNYGVYLHGFQ